MAAEKEKFIQGMHLKKGALHRQLNVPLAEPIPEKKLQSAAAGKQGPLAEKRAHTAQMLKGLAKGHKSGHGYGR